jgi:hypothetical protein
MKEGYFDRGSGAMVERSLAYAKLANGAVIVYTNRH